YTTLFRSPGRPVGSLESTAPAAAAAAVRLGRPARLVAAFPETAADLEEAAARCPRPPQAERRTRQRRENGQQAFESAYAPARRVRQMPLPFSLNATSSTRWRITNNPRPNSRSI